MSESRARAARAPGVPTRASAMSRKVLGIEPDDAHGIGRAARGVRAERHESGRSGR